MEGASNCSVSIPVAVTVIVESFAADTAKLNVLIPRNKTKKMASTVVVLINKPNIDFNERKVML
ncbi:hypothetical protein MASR2M36_25350 [Providencia sp.]